MELEGTVSGGMIVPDAGTPSMDDGTRIEFQMKPAQAVASEASDPKPGWFYELFKDLIVDDPDSPGDRAAQHDHYRLGTPKR
jgi:hypothetical protein